MNVINMVASMISTLSHSKQSIPKVDKDETLIKNKKRGIDEMEEREEDLSLSKKRTQLSIHESIPDSNPQNNPLGNINSKHMSSSNRALLEPKSSPFHYVNNKVDLTISKETNREHWMSMVDDMHCLCNKAAKRHYSKLGISTYEEPLSKQYMVDRVTLDVPMKGFVARDSKNSNKMLGFITTTTFSTWQRSFRWDSRCIESSITVHDRRKQRVDDGYLASSMMKKLKCFEDYERERMVWPEIAEISLFGGLGCGKLLLQTAIQELREMKMDDMKREYYENKRQAKEFEASQNSSQSTSRPKNIEAHESEYPEHEGEKDDPFSDVFPGYQVVVLQSTKLAVPFYEKMGFIRIGAVSRYHDRSILPQVPHRHWTNRIEHDYGSYMMALPLVDTLSIYTPFTLLPLPPCTPSVSSSSFPVQLTPQFHVNHHGSQSFEKLTQGSGGPAGGGSSIPFSLDNVATSSNELSSQLASAPQPGMRKKHKLLRELEDNLSSGVKDTTSQTYLCGKTRQKVASNGKANPVLSNSSSNYYVKQLMHSTQSNTNRKSIVGDSACARKQSSLKAGEEDEKEDEDNDDSWFETCEAVKRRVSSRKSIELLLTTMMGIKTNNYGAVFSFTELFELVLVIINQEISLTMEINDKNKDNHFNYTYFDDDVGETAKVDSGENLIQKSSTKKYKKHSKNVVYSKKKKSQSTKKNANLQVKYVAFDEENKDYIDRLANVSYSTKSLAAALKDIYDKWQATPFSKSKKRGKGSADVKVMIRSLLNSGKRDKYVQVKLKFDSLLKVQEDEVIHIDDTFGGLSRGRNKEDNGYEEVLREEDDNDVDTCHDDVAEEEENLKVALSPIRGEFHSMSLGTKRSTLMIHDELVFQSASILKSKVSKKLCDKYFPCNVDDENEEDERDEL